MRLRKLTAIFWAICFLVCIFIVYVVTTLNIKLPNSSSGQDFDDEKWSLVETKLKRIESALNEHHALVGEIESVINNLENSDKDAVLYDSKNEMKLSKQEYRRPKFNKSFCAIQNNDVPQTDVQMMYMYEGIDFTDIDGGVWKQGWDIKYDDKQWTSKNKLKVFILPHSHNDPGWLKTFEDYYKSQTRAIFTNMVEKLNESPGRKFIWAEISYLSLWWSTDASAKEKVAFEKLLKSGQIEIVTGGWVMNDEANSHWLSIIQQLTTGHQWLINTLNYMPKNSWAIDPFGHSSSQAYLLKLAGLQNSVIQRIHYRIKKEFAFNKQLEFNWRQTWDGNGVTDMFTHMFPFYSYDVPHSCGPDPNICCQFDFKRLPGNGVSCPWGTAPRKITKKNVEERAHMILDQWRKKSQLYRSNVVLFPLGDDFRYDRANEWDLQYQNYEMLIDYINSNDALNAEVQFGTLRDYFKAVHSELSKSDFPVVSGDFFTYSDRNDHYWSGYYTSRPFYKHMDRILMYYVHSAESIVASALALGSVTSLEALQLRDRVEAARRALALFQHHDGVTGTSRDLVREDYAKKLQTAIKYSQSAIQQSAYNLLNKPQVLDKKQEDIYFDVDDIWQSHEQIPTRITISLDIISPSRNIVLYNSLSFRRQEVIYVIVSTPYVQVLNPDGETIQCQISPVVSGEGMLSFPNNKYQVAFLANVEAMGLTVYTVSMTEKPSSETVYSRVQIYNGDHWNLDLPKVFDLNLLPWQSDSLLMTTGGNTKVLLNGAGLLKGVNTADSNTFPIEMEFVSYTSKKGADKNSGAYLFMPNGPSTKFVGEALPEIIIIEGPIVSSAYTIVNDRTAIAECFVVTSIRNNPSLPHAEVEISNTLLMDTKADDKEVALKLKTAVNNQNTFYTDLNGFQMIKRKQLEKLPLQGNVYALPAAAFVEDAAQRVTVLTSTPLGAAAPQSGEIEIMQDRRLSHDDNRGLNQGVLDNVRTQHVFRVIYEKLNQNCERLDANHPSGFLSVGAHVSQQTQLRPLLRLHYSGASHSPPPLAHSSLSADLVLASYRPHLTGKKKDGTTVHGFGMTFHRVKFDSCFEDQRVTKFYTMGDGQVKISNIAGFGKDVSIFDSSLTYTQVGRPIPDGILNVCPMEIKSVFIVHPKH